MSRYDPPQNYAVKFRKPEWEIKQKSLDHVFPILLNDDWFKEKDQVKWNLVRLGYEDGLIDLDDIVRLYLEWRDTSIYMMLDGLNAKNEFVMSVFVKLAKRGNDVYKKAVKKRFKFLDSLEPIHFFCEDWGVKKTPMLFISFTVDQKKYTIDQAYNQISRYIHLFDTKLRQKYGSFVKFKVVEAHESGYPHNHVIYYFHNKDFEVFEHITKKTQKRTFRVSNEEKWVIDTMWGMGRMVQYGSRLSNVGIDVQGVSDTLGAFSEVKKYITKNIWNKKGNLTNAMMTLYNKQVFWISTSNPFRPSRRGDTFVYEADRLKDFVGSIWGFDVYVDQYMENPEGVGEPKVCDLVSTTMHSCNNEFPEIIKWEFVGTILGSDLKNFVPKFKDESVYHVVDPPTDLYCCVNLIGVSGNYVSR